jgi:hypothetical protein
MKPVQKDLSLDAYILEAILQYKSLNGVLATDEANASRKRKQAAASILELRKGNILGPNTTIRDLIEEGRRF